MLKSPLTSILKNIASTTYTYLIGIWSGPDFICLKTSPNISGRISICNKTKLWFKQKQKLCFGCKLPKLPSPSDTYSCACGTMQHCNVEDISLQPPRLEAEEVREKNPYDTVHWGRREAANMNVVTANTTMEGKIWYKCVGAKQYWMSLTLAQYESPWGKFFL